MTNYNFEGEIDNINENQLEFINKVIKEYGSGNVKVNFETVGKAGDNYAANVKRITIKSELENITMIAKVAPMSEIVRDFLDLVVSFSNEHIVYTELIPIFDQLQKDANIPEDEQLRNAKCYGSSAEQPNEVILLEDLTTSKFTAIDRLKSLSHEQVQSVIKNFAKLHALSFVLKQRDADYFKNFETRLIDILESRSNNAGIIFLYKFFKQDLLEILEDKEHIDNVEKYFINTLNHMENMFKSENGNKYSVILHGDAWTTNLMFKSEEEKPVESIMIDYQLAKNGSPVYDLMFLIFNCTDYETRKIHFNDWIEYYYSELEIFLAKFDVKVNDVYPRNILDADLKRYGPFIFGFTLFLNNVLVRKSDEVANIIRQMQNETLEQESHTYYMKNSDTETKNLFKTKSEGIIKSFLELGLL